jgi:hypothetical protein
VFEPVRTPSSLTTVFTESIAAAEGSRRSRNGMIASLNGIETEQPRMPRARIPRTAPSRSVVVNAL